MTSLTIHHGESRSRSGAEVLDEIAELLDARLPDVPADDPVRVHLERFQVALTPLSLALSVVR